MKLVVLERNSVGTDVDVSCFNKFGDVTCYENTLAETVAERVQDMSSLPGHEILCRNEKTCLAHCMRLISHSHHNTLSSQTA